MKAMCIGGPKHGRVMSFAPTDYEEKGCALYEVEFKFYLWKSTGQDMAFQLIMREATLALMQKVTGETTCRSCGTALTLCPECGA